MFLSTTINSAMLNSTISNASFSFPYNFVRGRNLILNITPSVVTTRDRDPMTAPNSWADTRNDISGAMVTPNRLSITIPDNVTSYETTMTVNATQRIIAGQTANYGWQRGVYTLQIIFDITNGIIKFTPQSFTGDFPDSTRPVAVLITINTII